jgi:aspartate ammonia-lyase
MRLERDFLGTAQLDDENPFGIHTHRAEHNFRFSADRMRADIFAALILVKKAAALANQGVGLLSDELAKAIVAAADELLGDPGRFTPPLHPLQGGAGTSMNMAANEVLANLALRHLGRPFGDYDYLSPLDHVNLSQSTNDTVPTAVRIAVIRGLETLHAAVEKLLGELQKKERDYASILKIGRTELQDAMPVSVGQEFGAWAESVSRFRWRLDKAREWVRQINLGGTAVGTGINADRGYAALAVQHLRRLSELPLSQSRNLVDGTQNVDQLVEVSGLVKTGAASIKKIASDLRLLSSGPRCGIGELELPALQAGSSIMPGKVNPVMLEAVEQVCIDVFAADMAVTIAAAESNLELPQFLPLIAHRLLSAIETLTGAVRGFAETVSGIGVNEVNVARHLGRAFSLATLLTPLIGYERAAELVKEAQERDCGIVDCLREKGWLDEATLNRALTPGVMASPGLPFFEETER